MGHADLCVLLKIRRYERCVEHERMLIAHILTSPRIAVIAHRITVNAVHRVDNAAFQELIRIVRAAGVDVERLVAAGDIYVVGSRTAYRADHIDRMYVGVERHKARVASLDLRFNENVCAAQASLRRCNADVVEHNGVGLLS